MPSKRMLVGSITFSSSLPICAVSPAETLRSLTMPSNGARTSVRCSCWRAARRALVRAASRSLCALLRRTSASSSLLGRHHARGAQRLQTLELALGLVERLGGRARGPPGGFKRVADRGVVQAHEQVAALDRVAVLLEHLQHHGRHLGAQVGAPLGLHRTGNRGPEASALLRTVSRSSGEINKGWA